MLRRSGGWSRIGIDVVAMLTCAAVALGRSHHDEIATAIPAFTRLVGVGNFIYTGHRSKLSF
jgi:hypothetical protein